MAESAAPPAPTMESLMADNRRLDRHLSILANKNLNLEHQILGLQELLEAKEGELAAFRAKAANGASKSKEASKVVTAKA